jgi:predicted secreted hydrolase
LTLPFDEGKPPAINGVGGISHKGAKAGNASHHCSLPRVPTRGTLSIDGAPVGRVDAASSFRVDRLPLRI